MCKTINQITLDFILTSIKKLKKYYMTFDKIKLYQKNHFIKKVKYPQDGPTPSDFDLMEKGINDNLVNKNYLAENIKIEDEMICQYSGLPSLKSYKKLI